MGSGVSKSSGKAAAKPIERVHDAHGGDDGNGERQDAAAGGGNAARGEAPQHFDEERGLICRFCGGASCRHEDHTMQKGRGAIRGLHSNYVTKHIVAMQRPSSCLLRRYDVLHQMLSRGIKALINLQNPGEHPHCGPALLEPGAQTALEKSGFSYNPEEFMSAGIFYYNFGWVDMGTPSLSLMLCIMQVLAFSIREQKTRVAIHCHAGLGRTGLVAACWLVFNLGIEPEEAIAIVRDRRPGSVQTRKQKKYVHEFAEHLERLRTVFIVPPVPLSSDGQAFKLSELLQNQNDILWGEERDRLRYVPKVVDVLVSGLLAEIRAQGRRAVAQYFVDPGWCGAWGEEQERHIRVLKKRVNASDFFGLETAAIGPAFHAQLLLDFLDALAEPLIPPELTRHALEQPDDIEASLFSQIPIDAMCTLDSIIFMLGELLDLRRGRDVDDADEGDGEDEDDNENADDDLTSDLADSVCVRFSYALMHPRIVLPYPRPFRTQRVMLEGEELPGVVPSKTNQALLIASFRAESLATQLRDIRGQLLQDDVAADDEQDTGGGGGFLRVANASPKIHNKRHSEPTLAPPRTPSSPPASVQRRLSLRTNSIGRLAPNPSPKVVPRANLTASVRFVFPLSELELGGNDDDVPSGSASADDDVLNTTGSSWQIDLDGGGEPLPPSLQSLLLLGQYVKLTAEHWERFSAEGRAVLGADFGRHGKARARRAGGFVSIAGQRRMDHSEV